MLAPPCEIDFATGCSICSAVDATPAVPPHYDSTNVFGWDSGARSYTELDGDLFLAYEVPRPIGGAVCGIAPVSAYAVGMPNYVAHGIFVFSVFGVAFWQPWEHAETGSPQLWGSAADAVLSVRIVRSGAVVYYRVSDGVTVWSGTFATPSSGMQLTLGCLYASGDQII